MLALLSTVSDNTPQTEVSENAVERFLQGTTDEQREIALVSSIPRFFNQDILKTVLGTKAIGPSFEWLSRTHFVRANLEGWAYHDIVRSLMLRYFRLRSFQNYAEIHGKLAEYYNSLIEELGLLEDSRQENEIWQKYQIEYLYHSLCQTPQKHLSMALNGFISAWKTDHTYARQWIETIKQAGENSQVKEVQRWGNILFEGFEAIFDGDDYQVVIKMFTSLLDKTILETQWQADVLKRRSYYYNLEGQFSKALADSEEAIRLAPEEAEHRVAQAILYQSMKQHDEALAALDQAIKLKPEDPELARIRLLFLLKKVILQQRFLR